MPVGEPDPFGGEPVDVGGLDVLRLRAVTADIPVAEVVGQEDDDVGPVGGVDDVGQGDDEN